MENPVENKPQENAVKRTIDQLIEVYTTVKDAFFMNAYKENLPDAETTAGEAYTTLLNILHTLLELCKPDNINQIEDIIVTQQRIEALDRYEGKVDNGVIEELRNICAYLDSELLYPHLTTIKGHISI